MKDIENLELYEIFSFLEWFIQSFETQFDIFRCDSERTAFFQTFDFSFQFFFSK
jgi:hypothetical protein